MKTWRQKGMLACLFLIGIFLMGKSESVFASTKTAKQVAQEMRIGWNLGNTLDSVPINGVASYEEVYPNGYAKGFEVIGNCLVKEADYVWKQAECRQELRRGERVAYAWALDTESWEADGQIEKLGFAIWNYTNYTEESYAITVEVSNAVLCVKGASYPLEALNGRITGTMDRGGYVYQMNTLSELLPSTGELMDAVLSFEICLVSTSLEESDCIPSKEEYYEMLWGNKKTTKSMIAKIKEAGFGAVRIPVTYSVHMDEKGNIDQAWLDRIEEVVNYVIGEGMYAVINVHHDTNEGWLVANREGDYKGRCQKFTGIWKQVASHFASYGEKLIFEGFNEMVTKKGAFVDADQEALAVVNELNQMFVTVVRQAGGHNTSRFLIVNTYGASSSHSNINGFVVPKDTVSSHLIVGVHDYSPHSFAWKQEELEGWETSRTTWGTKEDYAEIEAMMKRLYTRFVSKGIPVMVGEFGTVNKNNESYRTLHAAHVVKTAKQYGIPCFWWDAGDFFDRERLVFRSSGVLSAMMNSICQQTAVTPVPKKELKTAKASLTKKTYAYTGKAITPAVTVKYGTRVLQKNKDYTVAYEKNKATGKGKIIIKGKGSYTGMITASFYIVPKKAVVNSLTVRKQKLTIKWKRDARSSGYEVVLSTDKKGTKNVKRYRITKNKTTEKKSPRLKRNQKYYVKVRAYKTIDGKKYYGSYSSVKAIRSK